MELGITYFFPNKKLKRDLSGNVTWMLIISVYLFIYIFIFYFSSGYRWLFSEDKKEGHVFGASHIVRGRIFEEKTFFFCLLSRSLSKGDSRGRQKGDLRGFKCVDCHSFSFLTQKELGTMMCVCVCVGGGVVRVSVCVCVSTCMCICIL